jgi:hypothetical protein
LKSLLKAEKSQILDVLLTDPRDPRYGSEVAGILGAFCSVGFESSPESSTAMKLPRIPATFKDPANPSNFLSAAEEIAQNPSKLPAKKSSGKIALTIGHFHDSSKQKRAIKNFRFVVNFSSSEFEIGCQVLFSDLRHYSQNSR